MQYQISKAITRHGDWDTLSSLDNSVLSFGKVSFSKNAESNNELLNPRVDVTTDYYG